LPTGYIYKHTNRIDGKVYIGQTIQKPEIRWGKCGVNYSGQRLFYRAILKYGWDNFDHEVLEIITEASPTKLKAVLNNKEVEYIIKFESMRFSKGYNTSLCNDSISTSLTAPAKRCLEYYIKSGLTLEEAYEAYKFKKDTKAYEAAKKYKKKQGV
jgi:hypothetical protein